MAVTVTLTFDTVDDMLDHMAGRKISTAPYLEPCCDSICTNLPVVPVAVPADPFVVIMNLFDNGKYDMRTLKTLAEKSGVSEQEVFNLLDKNDIAYNVKHRGSDGAPLIKLS